MWADPTIQLDASFASLIYSLQSTSILSLSIPAKQLQLLMLDALSSFNVDALLGATWLYFEKNADPNLRLDFAIDHLSNLDKMFYLVGERIIKDRHQNAFLRYLRVVFERWIDDLTAADLVKLDKDLKEEILIYEKLILMLSQTDKGHRTQLTFSLMKVFLPKKQKQYEERFKANAEFIMKNNFELFFLVVAYQMEYLVVKRMNSKPVLMDSQSMRRIFEVKLFNFTKLHKLSVSIESIAFFMRKYFTLHRKYTSSERKTILYQLQEIIETNHFSRINLEEKTHFYYYHMKNNSFFYYLEAIFTRANAQQYQVIQSWRQAVRNAMKHSIQRNYKKMEAKDEYDSIQQTIFYLQLRNKQLFLIGKLDAINHFPLIHDPMINRTLINPIFQEDFSAQRFIAEIIVLIDTMGLQGLRNLFVSLNLIEKGFFFYYLIYFESHRYLFKAIVSSPEAIATLKSFKYNIANQHLLELIEFYLIEIELGNHLHIQRGQFQSYNSVNIPLYEAFIQVLIFKLENAANQYKQLDSTASLLQIYEMNKYLNVLFEGLYDAKKSNFICKDCKSVSDGEKCLMCQHICVQIKLTFEGMQKSQLSKDKMHYSKVLNDLLENYRAIKRSLRKQAVKAEIVWIKMLYYLFEKLSMSLQ